MPFFQAVYKNLTIGQTSHYSGNVLSGFNIAALRIPSQLKWCGHFVRMDIFRLPRCVFYSQFEEGIRRPEGQFLKYKVVLKQSLDVLAKKRNGWRNTIHDAFIHFRAKPFV